MRKVVMVGLLAIGFLVAQALLGGLQAQEKKKRRGKGRAPYVHAVIFYLKKDAPQGQAEEVIRDSHKLLAKIPSVRGLWVGRPADKATPKFASTDYDVGLLILFDNYDGLQSYLDHAQHTEFVERHAKHFERVLVYDFMNQKK